MSLHVAFPLSPPGRLKPPGTLPRSGSLAIAPQNHGLKLKEGDYLKTIALHCKNVVFAQHLRRKRGKTLISRKKLPMIWAIRQKLDHHTSVTGAGDRGPGICRVSGLRECEREKARAWPAD